MRTCKTKLKLNLWCSVLFGLFLLLSLSLSPSLFPSLLLLSSFIHLIYQWFDGQHFMDMDIVNRWYRYGPFETDRLFFFCCWCISFAASLATDAIIILLWLMVLRLLLLLLLLRMMCQTSLAWPQQVFNSHTVLYIHTLHMKCAE